MIRIAAAAAGGAFLIAALGTPLVKRLAVAWGFVDRPRRERHHREVVPLLGGTAILAAILLPSLLVLSLAVVWSASVPPTWVPADLAVHVDGAAAKVPMALGILAGAIILHVAGLIDDRRGLPAWVKLLVQVVVAGGVVLICRVRLLEMFGEPFSSIATIVWIVLITNTFNLLDNIDGLAAGVAVICAAALLAAAAASGQVFVGGWLCLLAGAAVGFLVHNFPPAKIFMGDAGAMVLGYFLGVLSVLTTYYEGGSSGQYYGIFVPVVLLAVPLYDTFSVITLRLADRRNPMVGDTQHFSHRLLRRGMSPRRAVLTIYLATAATAIGASLLPHVTRTGAVLVFAQTVGIVLIIALLESPEVARRPRGPGQAAGGKGKQ